MVAKESQHPGGVPRSGVLLPSEHANESPSNGAFEIVAEDGSNIERWLHTDAYSAAKAFVEGRLTVRGDICEAVRYYFNCRHPIVRDLWFSARAYIVRLCRNAVFSTRRTSARNIRFHYDRSTAFYRQFLDTRLLYSAAHFLRSDQTLDEAQSEKLKRLCDALNLKEGDRLLDVGCGWGGLLTYAVEHFKVIGSGCTLSHAQFEFTNDLVRSPALEGRMSIKEADYRDLNGRFDKIASVGMFEHVGRNHLSSYFRKMNHLLADGGLFLNRGIIRPEGISDGPETLFLQEAVFPGGELLRLSEVVREAERAGFKILAMEDFSRDYAMTCRRWVERLKEHCEYCRQLVSRETYRTWLLYLAASVVSFEEGRSAASQILMTKRLPNRAERFTQNLAGSPAAIR